MTDESFLIEGSEVGAYEIRANSIETVMIDLHKSQSYLVDICCFRRSILNTHLAAELYRSIKSVYLIVAIEANVFFSRHRVDERIGRQIEPESFVGT